MPLGPFATSPLRTVRQKQVCFRKQLREHTIFELRATYIVGSALGLTWAFGSGAGAAPHPI